MSLTQSEILYIKTIMKSKNPSDNEAIEFYNEHKELFINMDSSDIKYIENSRTERGALPKWNVQRDGEVYIMCSKFILKNKDRKVGILDLDNKTFILDKDYTSYLPWPLYAADKDRNYIPTP